MKKDIPQHKVEHFAIAVVPREAQRMEDQELWDVWVINLREQAIENVLVSSRGYGEIEGEAMKTTTLRHFFNKIEAQEAQLLEPIQCNLFDIANEYWVSFTYGGYMYDKRYVFVQGSITPDNFTRIPLLERHGVMIR